MTVEQSAIGAEGEPVAIRYWPGGCVSIETMWNFHIAIGVDTSSRAALPRTADLEFMDDFWEASDSSTLILDRQPNETKAVLKSADEIPNPSANAVKFVRVVLSNRNTKKSLFLNVIEVDGLRIIDSNKNLVPELISFLQNTTAIPESIRSIDAFLIDDASADANSYRTLHALLPSRVMILREACTIDVVGDEPVAMVPHNTFAISKATETDKTTWVKLVEKAWTMEPPLADLFNRKEAASKMSRTVFAELSVQQMNFRPANGTHTPRWNAEHMMGRELLFFSQIYHAVDHSIPVMDLNPKQMPPDYQPAHADWTGVEEALQLARVEAFTRRFAYLLDGMNLDATAKGSSFWTPRRLLKQMDVHYSEHTANVVKKKILPEWPQE